MAGYGLPVLSFVVGLLLWQWRPIPTVVWEVVDPTVAMAITIVSLFGWAVVFGSTMEGNFFALDARTGKDLWHFPGNEVSFANPISYLSNGKQQVAIAIGDVLMAFGLD